jgi:hypothetical protein
LPKQFAACRLVSLRTCVMTVRHMDSEIIEVVERRRHWPVEVRLRILDEVLQPGASVSAVAGPGIALSVLCGS